MNKTLLGKKESSGRHVIWAIDTSKSESIAMNGLFSSFNFPLTQNNQRSMYKRKTFNEQEPRTTRMNA